MSDRHSELPGRAAALRWLGHPGTVLALVVLVLNDHLFKACCPGAVTGKLSDVAGLVLAPPVLAAVAVSGVPRLPVRAAAAAAIVLTGIGFTVVKSSAAAAAVASGWWSVLAGPSVVLPDRTDLAALPALGLAGWFAIRAGRPAARRAGRRRFGRPGAAATSRFGVLIVLPAAVLAIAATSAPQYPDAVAVYSWRGMIVAGEGNAYHKSSRRPRTWQVSTDGGRSWRHLSDAQDAAFRIDLPVLAGRTGPVCAPASAHCYRVVSGRLGVEQSTDGGTSWQLVWAVPEPQRELLADEYEDLGDPDFYLATRAVAVVAAPGGHAVVAANGRDGYAVREPTGRWDRIGFGTMVDGGHRMTRAAIPLPAVPANTLSSEIPLGLLAGAVVFLVGGWAAAWRRARWPLVVLTVATSLAILGALLGVLGMRLTGSPLAYLSIWLTWLGTCTALLAGLGVLVAARLSGAVPDTRGLLLGVVGVLGVAVSGGCAALFVSWSVGVLGYRGAALPALAGMLAATALAGWLGALAGRPAAVSRRTARPPSPTSAR